MTRIVRCVIALIALQFCTLAVQSAWADSPVWDSMPPATYPSTYSEQQWITMDDGVKLGATITFPSENGSAPAPGRFPVVLSMTPYGRDGLCSCAPAADFATRGFVVAVVDVRGTGGSQGNLNQNYFSPREARDGYDLVQYLGTRPWSNGKVGMSGGSYLGIVQYKTAETDPSHLAAIVPDEALADIYSDAYAPGGIVSGSFDSQYVVVQPAFGATPNTDPSMLAGTITAEREQAGGRAFFLQYLENPFDDAFYRARNPITAVGRIKVPVFVQDGWRDGFFTSGDLRMFQALEKRHVPTYLNVGPCTHKGCGNEFAPTDNPPNLDNVEAQEIRFDQHYLMGMNVPLPPRVRLYDQQADKYIDTSSWPPPRTRFERVHLGQGTLSETGLGTGTISTNKPRAGSAKYFTNPAAGFSMALDSEGTIAASPYVPTDQQLEENQGLTWRSPALSAPLTLAGPIALHLVAASSASNTDWFAKISDVSPSGAESIVAEGQLRASLRALAPGSTPQQPLESLDSPQPIKPGKFYDYEISIIPTAYTFAKGDRLQIRLTSNNLPNGIPGTVYLNPSDPADLFTPLSPALNTVRFGGTDGTSLLLPAFGATGRAKRV